MNNKNKAPSVTLTIQKLDDDFAGVAYVRGQRYVVHGALPEEVVTAQVVQTFGSVHLCRLQRVLQASRYRVPNKCPHHNCGGCGLRHMQYDYQLQAKQDFVRRKLHGMVAPRTVLPTQGTDGLRNKVHLAFALQNGKVIVGFFDSETHRVVSTPDCLAHGRWYAPLVHALQRWAVESGNDIYNPQTGKGCLRYAVVRRLTAGMSVTLVGTRMPDNTDKLYLALTGLYRHVGLWFNANSNRSNQVFGEQFTHLAGETALCASILEVPFALAPNSFFQTNTQAATYLYQSVVRLLQGYRWVADLYAGIGITTALLVQKGCEVHSVESNASACEDMKRLLSGLPQPLSGVRGTAVVHCGSVDEVLPTLPVPQDGAVFADPPRAGLSEKVCQTLLLQKPKDIVYMSCNVATLAQDIAIFQSAYKVVWVQPVDMFPNTPHVETLVRLSRNDTNY